MILLIIIISIINFVILRLFINYCENILGNVRGKPQDVEKFLDSMRNLSIHSQIGQSINTFLRNNEKSPEGDIAQTLKM